MLQDISFALRQLIARPAFTLTAALSLALGIGLVATQFSLIDAVLLRGLPVPDIDDLYHLAYQDPKSSDQNQWQVLAHRDYVALRERQTTLQTVAATQWSGVNLSGAGLLPSRHSGAYVTASLIEVLRVPPMLGRWFTPEENRPGQPLAVVLSHALWQDQFGASPAALGRAVNVNGTPATVIGVMPPKFTFPGYENLWINLQLNPGDPRERLVDRVELFGRLKPGVTAVQAKAGLDALAAGFAKAWPETNQGYERMNLQKLGVAYSGGGAQPLLYLMLAMTVLILALACVNVASMLLGRASQRTRELAVRAAVGASRARLLRQLLLESLLLALLGCAGGLLVAGYGIDFLQHYLVTTQAVPSWMEFRLDHRVLGIAMLSTLLAGLLAGIVPGWQASRIDVNTALKDDSRAAAGMGLGRLARWLVSAQITFSTMLLVAAGVLSYTVYLTRQANLRYDPDKLLTGRIEVQEGSQPTPEARARFYQRLLDRLQAEPGVDAVAVTSRNLIATGVPTQVGPEGVVYNHDNARPTTWLEVVSHDYFRLVSAKPSAGRLFDSREQAAGAPRTALVNESFARKFWPGADPLGRRFRTSQTQDHWITVVGVVPDLQMQGIFAEPGKNEAGFYLSQDQMGWGWLDLFIRTKGDPLTMVDPVRKAIAGIDPNQPIFAVGSLTSQMAQALRGFSIIGIMAVVFATITLFLGAVGVYGVTSQAISRRTREFGIRLALGSTFAQLLRLVLRQGARQIGFGLLFGLGFGYFLTRPLEQVFGGSLANHPGIYLTVAALIALVGLLALWLPARRTSRVDPMTALRSE
ncbi:MAG: ABC transporter permease [Opitutae bacterium]|nr:ABC transporter permease [Opitutae bacterium]